VPDAVTARNREAIDLFAPLGPTYDRYARLLSFGQDPRWRRFLVSRIAAAPSSTVLDVACGTAAVALELVRQYGCAVVGVDQSAAMLEQARERVARTGASHRITLERGRGEALPFPDASFDALTVTYLLRYVDDPAEAMRELARVVRPGGRLAMLDFSIPENALARALWNVYVDVGLPALGRTISPGWREVGDFLGGSIRSFHERYDLLELWRQAGIRDVQARRMSLGGGIVVWGDRNPATPPPYPWDRIGR
jgi:demethylmenaquinone methyltransferase / 2-methoxy-6-polyprenyl-1,4-benzoquinol methylase